MNHVEIEKKWQKRWEQAKNSKRNKDGGKDDKKYYVLEMFSYPSGYNLHVGHWYNFAPADTFARFKRMQGYNVFQPMGFDAFGLPAENHAIKTGIHPEDNTRKNIKVMQQQLRDMGAMYDWDAQVVTCDPDYYRWTQWLFLQLYKKGLAYQKEAPVNWCTSCNTVIANEQVEDGRCERCKSEVVRKNSVQWFFKITDYAEELLSALPALDWPEKTKAMQKNWIGKSVGSEISFDLICDDSTVCNTDKAGDTKGCKCCGNNGGDSGNSGNDGCDSSFNSDKITVFTTRADTLPGVSYVVLAPEHPLVDKITTPAQKKAVDDYRKGASKLSDLDRTSDKGEKTGVFTGAYCKNPLTGEKVPVWIAAYCLATYGTGAVMGVAAHDTRDFDFATKYELPITRVIKSADGSDDSLPFTADGILVDTAFEECKKDNGNKTVTHNNGTNSENEINNGKCPEKASKFGDYVGLSSSEARKTITEILETAGMARFKTTFRLRDWSVSRQRYWGTPIPMIYCDKCGCVPVPENQLPVTLPYDVNFTPDGQSPLGKNEAYMTATCPVCGGAARRDPDTLDTFVCSSWYFLRYADSHNTEQAFGKDTINKMLPVDKYVGGAEHACMHLLYSRFMVKALRDMGHLDFDEPFTSLVHQGMILGTDGEKMSKSNGNVINPDDFTSTFGSDIFRMYLMFGFSYLDGGPWSDSGIKAMARFFDRTERVILDAISGKNNPARCGSDAADLLYALNYATKSIRADLEVFSFNTAIARLMELVNSMSKYEGGGADSLLFSVVKDFILLIAPFAPHFAEEMNELCGGQTSVFDADYPVCDERKLVRDEVELAVQINSKIRSRITVPTTLNDAEIAAIALSDDKIKEFLTGDIKKTIVIKGKLINFIV